MRAIPDRSTTGRYDIQGLRAFAVILVILDHLIGWPRGGFVGVDVFFVLSGFLITGLLLKEHERTGRISFRAFYKRRIKRIIPAAVLVLLVTVVSSWFIYSATLGKAILGDAIWSLFFVGNWRFAVKSTNYFEANGPTSPLQNFWSLGVEEQFYLVWPLIMLVVFAMMLHRGHARSNARTAVGVGIGIISMSSFAWAMHETAVSPSQAYFSTFSRTWELGVGAMLAVSAPALGHLPLQFRPILAWGGLAAMVASPFVITSTSAFPAPMAALPVLATACVVAAGTGVQQQRYVYPITNRVSGYIGDISYSLYLWHFPVIILGTILFGQGLRQTLIIATSLTVAAIYTYHLLEDPIRRSTWLQGQGHPRPSLHTLLFKQRPSKAYKTTALSCLGVVSLTMAGITLIPPTPPSVIVVAAPVGNENANNMTVTPKLAAHQKQIAQALQATEWPQFTPSVEDVIAAGEAPPDVLWCGSHLVVESRCTWGDLNATHTIIMVGSSVSMTYVSAIRKMIGTAGGWRIISYGMFGCQFMDKSIVPAATLAQMTDLCRNRSAEAMTAIERVKPDVLIVSGIETIPEGANIARAELDKVPKKTQIVLLPGPNPDVDIRSCYTRHSLPSDCVGHLPEDWNPGEAQISRGNDIFIDPNEWFCYDGKCPLFVGRIPVKMDKVHMSEAYAHYIAPIIFERFQQKGVFTPRPTG